MFSLSYLLLVLKRPYNEPSLISFRQEIIALSKPFPVFEKMYGN